MKTVLSHNSLVFGTCIRKGENALAASAWPGRRPTQITLHP